MQEGQGINSFLGLSQLVRILQDGNSFSRRYETVPGSRELERPKINVAIICQLVDLSTAQ